MKLSKLNRGKFATSVLKIAPQWSKNTAFIVIGIFLGIVGVGIVNPGDIVQKSLSLVGIERDNEQMPSPEQVAQVDLAEANKSESENATTGSNPGDSNEVDDKKPPSSTVPRSTKTGSETEITPEEIQELKDSGQPLLIAKSDWNVRVNSRSPASCGTSSSPCAVGQQAKVNVSAYNTHTNELLPITECNGVVNKPYAFSDSTSTTLIDDRHCEITYTPNQVGMYRLQIELYLSKSVYTDTIYWGGWVWGTDSPASDGYFVH